MAPDNAPVVWCAACGLMRSPVEALAFWPVADPAAVRYVCRPGVQALCFARIGGPATVHTIASAGAPREAAYRP